MTVSPTTVTLPANTLATSQIQPPVTINLSTPTQTGSYTVGVTDTDFATDATPVVVTVNQPSISSINFGSPLTMAAGMHRDSVSVQLDTPAPAGGLTVNLASTAPGVADVPLPSILIPAGQQSGTFTVTGLSTGDQQTQSTQITGSAQGWISQTLNVTVVQPVLVLSNVVTPRTVNGPVNNFTLQVCIAAFNCLTR